ncbi:MAG: hypothetical protein R3C70_16865 [Geminicoccaceae bacterium]|nr:hypothetical protein [Geminicoccaceae bacterium]
MSGCAGARNLLEACLGARPGDRITIVAEPAEADYYDSASVAAVIDEALDAGMYVRKTVVASALRTEEDEKRLLAMLDDADHVVFFARAGDQIRFHRLPAGKRFAVSYALDIGMLDSPYGATSYDALCRFKLAVDELFDAAGHIRVTCPAGTDLEGMPTPAAPGEVAEVSIRRFPMLVPKPVSARRFSGNVVLSRFLLGTGSRFYDPYALPLASDIRAVVDRGHILRFAGDDAEVARINEHYRLISGRFGIDPWVVHSFHAGIHPACRYERPAETGYERWGGAAFGNPRILHFHTCGDYAPGEISWNVIDPTIIVDGVPIWSHGRLLAENIPGARQTLSDHPDLAELFANPAIEIGI